jgi:hypothetical protein
VRVVAMLNAYAILHGWPTRQEAHAQGICIFCKREISQEEWDGWSVAGRSEYAISGVCEPCYEGMFKEE